MRVPDTRLTSSVVALLAALAFGGCATIFTGTTGDLKIDSTPSRAYYQVITAGGGLGSSSGQEIANGLTPAVVNLSRKNAYIITVKLDGYQEAKVKVDQEFNYWVICSLVCGLVGGAVDVFSGAFWNLGRDQVALTLEPAAARRPGPPGAAPAGYPPAPPPAPSGLPPEPTPTVTPEGGLDGQQMYLVLYRRGDDGELRSLAVPLIPEAH